jgi:transcriptional regulator with XRE-family HTH domain
MDTIKEWLKANRRPLSYLADISGVSRQALDSILRGKSTPTIATLYRLAKATEIPFALLADEVAANLPEPPAPGGGEAA